MLVVSLIIAGPIPWLAPLVTSPAVAWILSILGTVLLGIGMGLSFIPCIPMVRDSIADPSEDEMNQIAGIFGLFISLGEFCGPLIGGVMFDRLPQTAEMLCNDSSCVNGWQYSTFVVGLFTAAVFLISLLFLPNSSPKAEEQGTEEVQ